MSTKSYTIQGYKNLTDLRADWHKCDRCPLADTRRRVVFGEGNPEARVVFISDYPGTQEDVKGKPLVSTAGLYFEHYLLKMAGLKREDVFITNILGCKVPQRLSSRVVSFANVCLPRVYETLYIIDPLLIVGLGSFAVKMLSNAKYEVETHTGLVVPIELPGKYTKYTKPLLVLPNPIQLWRAKSSKVDSLAHHVAYAFTQAINHLNELKNIMYQEPKTKVMKVPEPEVWKRAPRAAPKDDT